MTDLHWALVLVIAWVACCGVILAMFHEATKEQA